MPPEERESIAALRGAVEDIREDIRSITHKIDNLTVEMGFIREKMAGLVERDRAGRDRLDRLDATCELVSRTLAGVQSTLASHEKWVQDHTNLHNSDTLRFHFLLSLAVSALIGVGLIVVHII